MLVKKISSLDHKINSIQAFKKNLHNIFINMCVCKIIYCKPQSEHIESVLQP
jgi:hypothetical protein